MPPRKNKASGRWEQQKWTPRNAAGVKRRIYVVCPPEYNTPAFCRHLVRQELERHMGLVPRSLTRFDDFVRDRFMVEYPAARNLRESTIGLLDYLLGAIAGPELGALPLAGVDAAAVARRCGKLRTEMRDDVTPPRRRYSDRTIRHVVVAVLSVLRWAKRTGEIVTLPELTMPKVAEAKAPQPYTRNEAAALIGAALDEGERALLLLLYDAGLRKSETLGLQWPKVNFDRHALTVDWQIYRGTASPTKGGRNRQIPMSGPLERSLIVIKHLRGPYVLADADGEPRNENWIRTVHSRARRAAGLRHARIHDARHNFSTARTDEGMSPFALRDLLGHRDIRTTQGYVHASAQQLGSVLGTKGGEDMAATPQQASPPPVAARRLFPPFGDTQWVCIGPAVCKCSGVAGSCECARLFTDHRCGHCGRKMHEIEVNSGAVVRRSAG